MLRFYSLLIESKTIHSVDESILLSSKFFSSNAHSNPDESIKKSRVTGDLVGQPHPESNLRSFSYHIPENESQIEKKYRKFREEVHEWNQKFWTSHNNKFVQERKDYIIAHKRDCDEDSSISADKMSEFYKTFLDENWKLHFNYNIEWYKKNANLVALEVRVKLFRLFRRIFERKENN